MASKRKGKLTLAQLEDLLEEIQAEVPHGRGDSTLETISDALQNAASCETLADLEANIDTARVAASELAEALEELLERIAAAKRGEGG